MGHKTKSLILLAVGALLAGGFVWFCLVPESGDASHEGEGAVAASAVLSEPAAAAKGRRVRSQRIRERSRGPEGMKKTKPTLEAALKDEEVSVSPAFRKLLVDIQSALDDDDWRKLIGVVQKMQSSDEWPDGIPKVIHEAAIDALRWFGAHTAPELVGYLASGDAEVAENAMDAMMDALSDFAISDRERSALLLGYLKAVNDADAIDMMLMELDSMRPTVRAQTAISILEGANATAVGALKENVELFFGDLDDLEVTDIEGIRTYLSQAERAYREDPELAADDEEFYGGDRELAAGGGTS